MPDSISETLMQNGNEIVGSVNENDDKDSDEQVLLTSDTSETDITTTTTTTTVRPTTPTTPTTTTTTTISYTTTTIGTTSIPMSEL